MLTTKNVVYAVSLVAFSVASFVAMKRVTPQAVAHDLAINVREFTIVQNAYNPDGTFLNSHTIERRKDGAIASTSPGSPVRKVSDGSGVTYIIYDPLKMMLRYNEPNVQAVTGKKMLAIAPGNCEQFIGKNNTFLRRENVAGFDAAVIRSAGNPHSSEIAYAPALGCQPIRIVAFEGDTQMATTITESVKWDQIDPALFDIPDYPIVKPSDGVRALAKYHGIPWNKTLQAEADLKDEIFSKSLP